MYGKKRKACINGEQVEPPRVMAARSLRRWGDSSAWIGRDKRSGLKQVKREGGAGHQLRGSKHGKCESITKEERGDGQERIAFMFDMDRNGLHVFGEGFGEVEMGNNIEVDFDHSCSKSIEVFLSHA